jgi:membrane dipeptidase
MAGVPDADATYASEARRLHEQSLVLDAASFFCTGYDDDLAASGVTSLNIMAPWPPDDFEEAVGRTEAYWELVRHEDRLRIVSSTNDIRAAKAAGTVALVLGTQNARLIGDRLVRIETLSRLGLRYVQLTYNERNFIGDGCAEPNDAGLSRFGREVVRTMADVGLVMDVTHAGPRTAREALEVCPNPAMISHANPRGLYDNVRNAPDDVIRALAAKGGVIGCTLPSPFNWAGQDALPTLDDFVRAIEYVVELVGEDHVAIGSDLVATSGAYPTELSLRLRGDLFAISGAFYGRFGIDKAVRKVQGIADIRDYPRLTEALVRHGFSSATVEKIIGANLLRVYGAVWKN